MTDTSTSLMLIVFVAFLVAMPLVVVVSERLRVPYTVVLVLVGLIASALPIHEQVRLEPGVAVALLLPGLVFEAAYRLDGDVLRRTFGSVALLAVPGVLITGAVVAVVLTLATGLPIEQAFVVGAIVSATDPVAVVSTMRRLAAPTRLVTLVDAESLFNDGTAALVFVIAVATLGATPPSLADDVIAFTVGLAGSVAIGAISGIAIARLLKATNDRLVELTLTVLAAYGTYLVADLLHGSGIIASVVAGIVLGTFVRRQGVSHRSEDAIDVVWDFLAFLLTGAAFLLIGLAIPITTLHRLGAVDRLGGRGRAARAGAGGLRAPGRGREARAPPGRRAVTAHRLVARHELDRAAWRRRHGPGPVDPGRDAEPRAAPGHRLRDRPVHGRRAGPHGRARRPLGAGLRERTRATRPTRATQRPERPERAVADEPVVAHPDA